MCGGNVGLFRYNLRLKSVRGLVNISDGTQMHCDYHQLGFLVCALFLFTTPMSFKVKQYGRLLNVLWCQSLWNFVPDSQKTTETQTLCMSCALEVLPTTTTARVTHSVSIGMAILTIGISTQVTVLTFSCSNQE